PVRTRSRRRGTVLPAGNGSGRAPTLFRLPLRGPEPFLRRRIGTIGSASGRGSCAVDRNCAPLWTSQGRHGSARRTSPSPCEGSMQCGSVDELLDVTVERPVLDELKVEVLRTLEDRVQPGLTGDDGEERHLYVVDESGSHQRAVHREA